MRFGSKNLVLSALFLGVAFPALAQEASSLTVTFADESWNGSKVPYSGVCSANGGKNFTPPISVANVPADANAIIVEYSDRTYTPHNNGGHGKIGYWIEPGKGSATLPAIEGDTRKLGDGAWVEGDNFDTRQGARGYLGPCSGGRGNLYEADLKAVIKSKDGSGETRVLSKGQIRLGYF